MKKSQILAALALAFALGVVAPVAGTYAKVAATVTTAQAEQVKADLADKEEAIEQLDGDVAVYEDGVKTEKTVSSYTAYSAVYAAVSEVNQTISDANEAQATALKKAIDELDTSVLKDTTAVKNAVKAVKSTKVSYADARSAANTLLAELAVIAQKNVGDKYSGVTLTADMITAAQTAVKADDEDDDNVTIREAIDAADVALKEAADPAAVTAVLESYMDTDNLPEETTSAAAFTGAYMTAVRKAMPDYNKWAAIFSAIEDVENAMTDEEETVYDLKGLNTLLAKVDAAIASFKNGTPAGDTDTETPGDDQNADADAPNTGALLSSDKGATTVSIVAGLATALTALGAGVVAYRNARRSSK